MATTKQRNDWEAMILADRPDINPWILKNLLDVYCAENGKETLQTLVKDDMKQARKSQGKVPVTPTKPSVVDGITVSEWSDVWENRARLIMEKAGARLLTENEAAKIRGEKPAVIVEDV